MQEGFVWGKGEGEEIYPRGKFLQLEHQHPSQTRIQLQVPLLVLLPLVTFTSPVSYLRRKRGNKQR